MSKKSVSHAKTYMLSKTRGEGGTKKNEELRQRTVTLKLKTVNFEVKTRSLSFANAVTTEREIWVAARELLSKEIKSCEPNHLRLRLMGVRLSNFENLEIKDSKQDKITNFLKKDVLYKRENFETQCNAISSKGSEMPQDNKPSEGISSTSETCFEAVCPVCNQLQVIDDLEYLEVFNKHVDVCLNATTIKEVLSEQTTQEKQTNSTQNSRGKRKQQSSQATCNSQSKVKRVTLEHFWNK